MKAVLILAFCIAAVHCQRRDRPDFDCDRWCRKYGYSPVCSDSNRNFENECYLECKWNYKSCDGRCPCNRPDPRPNPCSKCDPWKYDPVCTDDGTENNECIARCTGKYVFYDGPCYS